MPQQYDMCQWPSGISKGSCLEHAGLILLQLAIPKLRVSANIKTFNTQLKKFKYDLMAWRNSEGLSAKETAVLDANSGAGWNLAAGLLRPRDIKVQLYIRPLL